MNVLDLMHRSDDAAHRRARVRPKGAEVDDEVEPRDVLVWDTVPAADDLESLVDAVGVERDREPGAGGD